ncbi:hypothetical protein SSPSH_003231, partial [Salinisphaera shabanensis E1L3A]
ARAGPRPLAGNSGTRGDDVSIRAARAGPRPVVGWPDCDSKEFLSARPARGRDRVRCKDVIGFKPFLSARPARGRDAKPGHWRSIDDVSIRAARAGPRLEQRSWCAYSDLFLSARPARGRDAKPGHWRSIDDVSIRAARAGPRLGPSKRLFLMR